MQPLLSNQVSLLKLDPVFFSEPKLDCYKEVSSIEKAFGVQFLCPKCYIEEPPIKHYLLCWNEKVDKKFKPTPGRWYLNGTSFLDLTLIGVQTSWSIKFPASKCNPHFFLIKGIIQLV